MDETMSGRTFPFLEVVGVVVALILAIGLFVRARRYGSSLITSLCAAFNLLANLLVTGFILAHLIAVIGNALAGRGHGGAEVFSYDFRFYALLLMGFVILIPSVMNVIHSRGLAKGRRMIWRKAWWGTVILLGANVPLAPLQGFALGFSVLLGVSFVLLLACRGQMT